MKKMTKLMVSAGAVLIAGCAHHEQVTRYETTRSGSASPNNVTLVSPAPETRTVVTAPAETTVVTAPAENTVVTTPADHPVVPSSTDTTVVTVPTTPNRLDNFSYADVTPNIVSPVPPPANRPPPLSLGSTVTTTTTPVDNTVVVQVRQAMVNDPTIVTIAPDIQVASDKGTVTLTGNVANQDQRQRIEYLAKGITGVSTVNNQLQVPVSPTGRISQQTVIYSNAPQLSVAQPDSATAGRIYSSSSASSASATQPATQAAPPDAAVAAALDASRSSSSTPPATGLPSTAATTSDSSALSSSSVISTNANAPQSPTEQKDLTPTSDRGSTSRVYATNQSSNASSQSQPSADSSQTVEVRGTTDADKQIGAQFVQQLKNEPSLVSVAPSLRISIEDGKAILRGTVKSQDEKNKVEAVAKQVPGVTGVENQLTVAANGASQINETK